MATRSAVLLRLSLLLALGACATSPSTSTESKRPNLLILFTDDQGFGDCSAMNPKAKFRTPQLDRIAREGIRFTDAHSADTVCTPSRYALLTGRYAWRTPLKRGVLGADADCLLGSQLTIATFLREQGYHTGIIGKWHLGMQIPGEKGKRDWSKPVTDGPLHHGFDTFFGIPASMNFGVLTWFDGNRATAPADMWTRKKFPPAEIVTKPLDYRMAPPFDREPAKRRDIEVAASFRDEDALRIITDRTVEYLEQAARREKPFFLYVPFTSPHLPHCTAKEFRGKSGMGNYGDFMLETDTRVGTILDALDRLQLSENTIVVLTSDNGPENNYKDWQRIYGHACSGKFRGGKRDIYEGGHRVPFLVRWPARVASGRAIRTPICQTDIFATMAAVLDTALPDAAAVDSVSFLPQLLAQPNQPRPPIIHHSGSGHFAIRSGRHKLVLCKPGQGGRPRNRAAADSHAYELYDLATDPEETTNLIGDRPELTNQLQAKLTAILRNGRTTPGPKLANEGPAWWPQLTWLPKPR